MRLYRLLSSCVVAVVAIALVGTASAQEGTPAADPGESPLGPLPPGISAAVVGGAPLAALPDDVELLVAVRLTLDPGADFPPSPDDASGAFIVVERGAVDIRSAGPFTAGPAGPEAPRTIAADEETTLGTGESALFAPFQAAEVGNAGYELAVLRLVNVLPAGMIDGAATPTP